MFASSERVAKEGVEQPRFASATTAVVVGGLSLAASIGTLVMEFLVGGAASPSGSGGVLTSAAFLVFGLSFTAVGTIVARRQPRNRVGWLLLATALAIQLGSIAPAYAYLDYHHRAGALPLGPLAVLLSGGWVYGFLAIPLIILLFPDGQATGRTRWLLRAYLAVCAVFVVGIEALAVRDLRLGLPVDSSGNLVGLSSIGSGPAWFRPLYIAGFLSCFSLSLVAVVYQTRQFRKARGERRQQLKWLGGGAAICVVFFLVTALWSSAPAIVGNLLFPLALTALPFTMGIAILRYRLYEIDRLVSRTLSYALLTALLVGTFIGLIALSTNVLAISGRVGVALSTLAAAALFNPLRKRIQHRVDRRFNRARYDAEAIATAFAARVRNAVELEVIRTDLLDTVSRAVHPNHASVWIKP